MDIPYFKTNISEDAIDAVSDVLRSGWLTTGQQAKKFEEEFAEFVGGNVDAICVNSATAGLHLALEAVGITANDEVLVPSLTFTASAEVVAYLGAKVVLVDINPTTLSASIMQIKNAVTPKTKAIIFVHFGGYPTDLTPLISFCRENDLRLIEDAAHAIPARINGQHVGTQGSDAAVFSFYANKTMTTGEGGMIVTRNPDIAARCRLMRTHGLDRDAFDRFKGNSTLWQYDIQAAGFKYNMTDVAAALGRFQLRDVEVFRQGREDAAMRYNISLENLPITLPKLPNPHDTHAWHLYPVQFHGGTSTRDAVIKVFTERNIGYSVHYTPLHKLTYWSQAATICTGGVKHTDVYFKCCLSLPLFPDMTETQTQGVVRAIKDALQC